MMRGIKLFLAGLLLFQDPYTLKLDVPVVSVDVTGAASVRTAGGVERIDVNLVAPVGPGDLVLVHAGTAIALVGSDSA